MIMIYGSVKVSQTLNSLAFPLDKSEADMEREKNLMTQWLALAEERNNVLLPAAGSGVPGAPATG